MIIFKGHLSIREGRAFSDFQSFLKMWQKFLTRQKTAQKPPCLDAERAFLLILKIKDLYRTKK